MEGFLVFVHYALTLLVALLSLSLRALHAVFLGRRAALLVSVDLVAQLEHFGRRFRHAFRSQVQDHGFEKLLVPIVVLPACPPHDAVLLVRLVHAAPLVVKAAGANFIPLYPSSWCGLERNPSCR